MELIEITARSGLNVRKGPSTQYSVIKVLPYGTKWFVTGTSGDWMKIGYNQWIYGGYTKYTSPIKTVVTTANSGLNVRKGPSTRYSITRVLSLNTVVEVLEIFNGWYRISNFEWISGYYTKDWGQPSVIKTVVTTAKSGLNVRRGPSTAYNVVRVLPYNTKVNVYAENNGWYNIGTNEWIYAYYTKDINSIDNTTYSWCYRPNNQHEIPESYAKFDISKYNARYVGDTTSKKIYLTFDAGYEAGYTNAILDSLKRNNVQATFFVTKHYIDNNNAKIRRMVQEGHIVANHTNTHPSLPSLANNVVQFNNEIISVEKAYKNVTGKTMGKLMRPPSGEYSELTLYRLMSLGYKTIFWSFAYRDWEQDNQPNNEEAFNKITMSTHRGCIMLLHAVSKTNSEILDAVIKNIRNQGYSFASLNELL